ncbi:hypothetical protein PC129_g11547 [Phytophthora cactorum]|uniref:Uncharacterized protein n=1 Tax=Phytophthora cactorum TaxID=29920 RepID=A0A329SCY9_9STRA|nr:hypothetical protein Pcac1_g22030 [Phytophthora cactorum]KAG2815631.1 hypothetical protein PC112_g13784 [Phytophthora cactorum]KAG2817121.1 hypothetical protein PC111_g12841 [Phytophthora cactorum]KAG2853885.1 hypothetical protein PC113_g13780 [Phytophthora cactorum]KAG2898002.1 hypothetical protein PC114_g14457 [Phytophthora cactorum]
MFASIFTLWTLLMYSSVAENSNWIGLYRDAHFDELVLSLRDVKPQNCYNLLCQGVNNVVSSAAWLGWTVKASDNSLPQITFFMDKDCTGTSQGYKASGEDYPADFTTTGNSSGMDNKITSLIVYERNAVDVDNTITFCLGSTEAAAVGEIANATRINTN